MTLPTCLFFMCYPVVLPLTIGGLRWLGLARGTAIAVAIPLALVGMGLAVLLIAAVRDAIGSIVRRLKR